MNKIALITGSGKKRIGYHVAAALAQRGYGLAIHYHTAVHEAAATVEEFRRQGADAHAFPADLADETAVTGLVQRTLDQPVPHATR